MSYERLMSDHATIDALIGDLLTVTRGEPRPSVASVVLERLATAVRDHRATEERVLSATLDAAAGNRHAAAAVATMRDLDHVEEDWTRFLYLWSPPTVAARWGAFREAVQAMMPEIRAELAREAGILYSLAVHYELLAPAD